ncbi:hypothetical protein Taro_036235 [Colocasia esculenta]|uniref:AMP-dependent synthetase/ligase domain-containing protein n=1 Tax=Colocasia esculenta TaxID=4460 RepID=A0A843W669_COLES|nr:hypothetical protein [Colocasia esculenta]
MFPAFPTMSAMLRSAASGRGWLARPGTPEWEELNSTSFLHLVDGAASGLLDSGAIQCGDTVALPFPDSVESYAVMLAVMRCRAKALPLRMAAYSREELEQCLTYCEAKLLLTGPGEGDEITAAQAAALRLGIPHAVASLNMASGLVEVSSSVLMRGGAAGGLAEVVSRPWDTALLLHVPGSSTVALTQQDLALWVNMGGDLLNLLSQLRTAGSFEAASVVGAVGGFRFSHAGARAREASLKLESVCAVSAGALIFLISRQVGPQAAAAKPNFLGAFFFHLAVVSCVVGMLFKTMAKKVVRFYEHLEAAGIFFFFCAAGALALVLLP